MLNQRDKKMLANARSLRKNMTKEERHLWFDFLRYCTPRFRRQEIIGNYIADFYCSKAHLVVELDGSQHTQEQNIAYDIERTACFASQGISVLRYFNNDVMNNFDGVCQDILRVIQKKGLQSSFDFTE